MDVKIDDTMEIDSICDNLSGIKINNYININLINDLNLIIREIASCKRFDVDIYDICVACGNNIVWDQEYNINQEDIKWLSNDGKNYFFNTLHSFLVIDTNEKYNQVIRLYIDIFELFCKAA